MKALERAATAGLQPSAGLPTETCQLFTFIQYVTVSRPQPRPESIDGILCGNRIEMGFGKRKTKQLGPI